MVNLQLRVGIDYPKSESVKIQLPLANIKFLSCHYRFDKGTKPKKLRSCKIVRFNDDIYKVTL
jgi:hypothetical protein